MFKGLMIFKEPDALASDNTSKGEETSEVKEETKQQGTQETQGQPATNNAWMAQLPKDLRDREELKKFNSIGELASAFLGEGKENKEQSRSFLESITTEANKEEWDEFRKEYITDKSTEQDKKGIENYIDLVKKANLNSKQAKDLLNISKDVLSSRQQEAKAKKELFEKEAPKRCEEFLKKTWGEAYEKNTSQAKKGYSKLFAKDDEFSKSFNQSSYVNDPLIMELLSRVGSLYNEPVKAFEGKSEHTVKENGWGISEKFYK